VVKLQKAKDAQIVSISTQDKSIEDLLTKEWLLTNQRGSYASSTIVGCNTRGYHGLLVGSLNPPANRIMALSNCLEMVILDTGYPIPDTRLRESRIKNRVFNLSTFEFPGRDPSDSAGSPSDSDKFMPAGFNYIKQFHQDIGVHFDYELDWMLDARGKKRVSSISAGRGASHPSDLTAENRESRIELTKSVYLLRDTDTVALVYNFRSLGQPVEFVLRPFVGLRDFHTLQKSYAPLCSSWIDDSLLVCTSAGSPLAGRPPAAGGLFLSCTSMNPVRGTPPCGNPNSTTNNVMQKGKISNGVKFENDQQWWFNFVYRNDRERGQNFIEDLWTPGFFKCRIEAPTEIVLWATLSDGKSQMARVPSREEWRLGSPISDPSAPLRACPELVEGTGLRQTISDLRRHQSTVITTAKAKDERFRLLCLAADQFIVTRDPASVTLRRTPNSGATSDERRVTVLAGFPWFADWGRDAFITLPGLLLSTSRFDEAKSVLTTFAQAADEGMIPNRFDDRSNTAYFNSVDASLWFINAAFQYLSATDDSKTFTQELLPVIRWIIDSYQKGTRFGIHADTDGLITAGDNDTQLTWMDAKYDGVAFTPRCGKAVEVNALWYNALCLITQFYVERNKDIAEHFRCMAQIVAGSFCEIFWNEALGYLNDCILSDGSVDTSLRPNQIFAISLPFSPPLSLSQQKSIVDIVQKELLTPYGLRTLNVQHSDYKGTYIGPQQARDEAYHQGTVWPYLIGPFVEAYLKVNEFSRKSKKQAAEFIEPLMKHLTEDSCLGQIGEIFDGDNPHKPRGCIAQAWSVAELFRAYQLINS